MTVCNFTIFALWMQLNYLRVSCIVTKWLTEKKYNYTKRTRDIQNSCVKCQSRKKSSVKFVQLHAASSQK